jgi:uncharacterized protein (TIGR02246 family)
MIGADIQDPQTIKAQIDGVVKALGDSWNTHDMALFGAQFTEDADFVNVLGMDWHGREEIESHHAAVHSTIFRNSKLRMLDYSLRPIADGVMLALMRWERTGHESPPDVRMPEVRKGVATGVFVQRDGRWLITAFHNTDTVPSSLPAYR